jgi:hypothetical protein
MGNPEKHGKQEENKKKTTKAKIKYNTICVGHHHKPA